VHESLVISDYTYDDKDFPKQGYLYFCPNVKAPNTTMYYGYDPEKISSKGAVKVPHSFITAGYGIEGTTFFRKGIDLIFEIAPLLPDCTFTIVGCLDNSKFKDAPSNIKLLPPVNYEELISLYSTHRFYLQISIAEGFPSAICEAMLCECVPIGSRVAAIPMIIGDTGFILEKRNKNQLLELINHALNSDTSSLGQKARERIKQHFPPQKREKELLDLVEKLIGNDR
jgi:glycosyltransferase involved in cell wall biosynthesis